ncbi:MAG: prolipoprotein diacylglyceryl transferase family protein [Cyanobacteria bacterium P01_C01_bin.118]
MQFPVYIGFGTWKIHPHFLFEFLGYVIAFRLLLRRNLRSDPLPLSQRTSIITGGMVGAVLGAKLLVLLQHIDLIWLDWRQWLLLIPQGKTIVGALLGGLIGVEVTKSWIGVTRSTGDVFVYPLLVGTAIGRIGCFLTGLSDRTYGITTSLPWGINFGDGILRHPTQLYEILFLLLLGIALAWRKQSPYRSGELFQLYLGSYLSFRFLIDFLKPDFHLFLGMSAVQCACLLGMLYTYRTRQSITPH